jgi:spermidine/putrescine-binding protein
MVHDYQLTAIGNALKSFGYSFNSLDPKELADAEKLLIEVKPHLFAINSDIQPSMRSGDAWLAMSWTGDASQLHRDNAQMQFSWARKAASCGATSSPFRKTRSTRTPPTPSSTTCSIRSTTSSKC